MLYNYFTHSELSLFFSDDIDPQKENCRELASSPRPRNYQPYPLCEDTPMSPGCSTRPHPGAAPRRLKRKQMFAEDEELMTPFQTAQTPGSGGMGERLLEMLNPSKRPCYGRCVVDTFAGIVYVSCRT